MYVWEGLCWKGEGLMKTEAEGAIIDWKNKTKQH